MTSSSMSKHRGRRARSAAVVVVLVGVGLLAPLAAAPARAATPTGGPSTPGVWGTHAVTFTSLGRTVGAIEVADGHHAPRQPAPPAADGVFDGWFVDGDPDTPFSFSTTTVTTDLTVAARFTDTHVVQFVTPGAETDQIRVLDADEVADGAPLGDVAPDVQDVPAGQVFTGQWYRQGDLDRTPYDFDTPVTANLRLAPVLAAGFAVSFVTDGTAVEPVFVLEPDEDFTAADLAAVPEPTRVGYTFTRWWANAARTQPVTFPVTGDTTLYAGWDGQDVEYHVSYWLEKADVVPDEYPAPVFTPAGGTLPDWGADDGALSAAQLRDPNTFDFLEDTTDTATAGTTVGGPTDKTDIPTSVQDLVRAQLDPDDVQPDPLTFADLGPGQQDVTVAGDGSTVVNVYLTRALWRADFRLLAPGSLVNTTQICAADRSSEVTFTVGGKTYFQGTTPGDGRLLGTFSVRTKIGFSMAGADVAPTPLSQADGSEAITIRTAGTDEELCAIRGWGRQLVNPVTFTANYTGASPDADGVDVTEQATALSGGVYRRDFLTATERFLYVETVDQNQTATDTVIGADGIPNNPLHVATLFDNDRTTPRVQVPEGHQIFEQYLPLWYWTGRGDRQVGAPYEGFTSYVGYGVQPGGTANFFQLDEPTNRFYQLKDSGNTNDRYRYQFYSRNVYNLTYVTGGGTAIPARTGIPYGGSLDAEAPMDPTRGNDVFQGWFTDSDFNSPFTFDGATMPASNLVLYAKWLNDPHTVRFFGDPSAPTPITDLTETIADQGYATAPAALPPRADGSTFLGWYQRTADGYFVPYDFDTPVGSDLDLYARWQQPPGSPFRVRYDGDGNSAGQVPSDPDVYDAASSAIVADGAALRRGTEVFVGWQLRSPVAARIIGSPEGGPVDDLYQTGHTVNVGGRDVVLVATYANPDPRVTIRFDENGGPDRTTAWDGPPHAEVTYPDEADLAFTGPGTRFLGWSTDEGATVGDPAYDRLTVADLAGDLTLYAVWVTGPTPPPTPTPGTQVVPSGFGADDGGPLAFTGADLLPALVLVGGLLTAGVAANRIARRIRRRQES